MPTQPTSPPTLEEVLARATQLYSLPAVAMEVVRLTSEPEIDARAIRDCVQLDPAMTAKLLRVVNSSLYGLRGEVSDLNQAIALLGVKPLKLLVLGFSLPDELLEESSTEALRRYWTDTLTRAAAARAIAELGWKRGGDDAQLAAMLQGIGQLVLMTQLGEPYADLLLQAGNTQGDATWLAQREIEGLGFDHRTLSAELLRSWSLPDAVVDAIALQTDPEWIATHGGHDPSTVFLPRVLRLANLLTNLVGHHQLAALPALVEEGAVYCDLTRRQINSLVEGLQEKVDGLAEALSVDLEEERDYQQTLLEAHAQMSVVAEGAACQLLGKSPRNEEYEEDDRLCDELLADVSELSAAMKAFLAMRKGEADPDAKHRSEAIGRPGPRRPHHHRSEGGEERLLAETVRLAGECRSQRQPLSIVLVESHATEDVGHGGFDTPQESPIVGLRRWLAQSPWRDETAAAVWIPLSHDRFAVLLPRVERRITTRLLNAAGDAWESERGEMLDAGVATIAAVGKGFDAGRLITASERCLAAALASGAAAVKSIEVF